MLDDSEIVRRMIEKIATLPEGSEFSTESLLKTIPIREQELLPVGDLTGIHNLLLSVIATAATDSNIAILTSVDHERYLMPYKKTWTKKS